MPTQQARAELMATSDEFRRLAAQHSTCDRRIEELSSRKFPSQEEQIEEARLKKLKLHLKDQMQHMVEDTDESVH
ncbi:MAG: DUF465 domain-containing protein [Acidobacteria bacterium]|nr:DUF465 domain-containing protein [Acidobacteriota bacterium]